MQQRNEDFIDIAATKITLCALIKNYLIPKNITQIKIGKRQQYPKLNRVKEKLYVNIMCRLRDLIMELYTLPSLNGCGGGALKNFEKQKRLELIITSTVC